MEWVWFSSGVVSGMVIGVPLVIYGVWLFGRLLKKVSIGFLGW